MRAQTPSPKSVPFGTTTAARPGFLSPPQLAHDELEEEQGGFGGAFVVGEIVLNAFFLRATEGRIGENHIHALLVADFRELVAQRVAGVYARGVKSVQQKVHLAEQIGQRFWLAALERLGL